MPQSHVAAYQRALSRAEQLLHLLSIDERDSLYDQWDDLAWDAQHIPAEEAPLIVDFLLAEQNQRATILSSLDADSRILLWLRARSLALQAANQLAAVFALAGKEGLDDAVLLAEFATPSLPPTLWPTGMDTLFYPRHGE